MVRPWRAFVDDLPANMFQVLRASPSEKCTSCNMLVKTCTLSLDSHRVDWVQPFHVSTFWIKAKAELSRAHEVA
eukprot:29091-Eustigmatos_ZCMA.PRE.1